MKRSKKLLQLLCAGCMSVTSLSSLAVPVMAAETEADQLIRLKTSKLSPFNDTDGDGLPEFEGWGSSLCWWANRIGSSEALSDQAAKLFYSPEGLDLNIGRYNLGGGDLTAESITPNEKAVTYGLEDENAMPSYSGSKMNVSKTTAHSSSKWLKTDLDLGVFAGDTVGELSVMGWVNGLGEEPGNGSNLSYTVQADHAGTYTVKLLLLLIGAHDRGAALEVNGETVYKLTTADIDANKMAYSGNNVLYKAVFENVELKEGENTLTLGGNTDLSNHFLHDYISMTVTPSEDLQTDASSEPYVHKDHIIRSDSAVPGYAADITPIVISEDKPLSWYEENFDRADAECGFAWNYDWNADASQLNVLRKVSAAAGEDFIAEIFSNSPPYFMTESGCSSGNHNANSDNLRSDSYNAFAKYMADVIEHYQGDIDFQSATPVNEPDTNYWGAWSNKQEGCHFSPASTSKILSALNAQLEEKEIDLILSASDETNLENQIRSWNSMTDEAKNIVERIDVHTYGGSDRAGVKKIAQDNNKNLWMSEVDGSFTAGENAGEMSAALGLANRIVTDLDGLNCSAWILWNLIDKHADSSELGQKYVNKGSGIDKLTIEDLNWPSAQANGGYWGVAAADHNNETLELSMKYYALGQFSRYIRPGYALMESNGNTVAAYDPQTHSAVVVAVNDKAADSTARFDLSGFTSAPSKISAIRTSGTMKAGEKWADVSDSDSIEIDGQSFTASLKGNSITTYIIEGVGTLADADQRPLVQIPVDASQVTGSTPWNNGADVPANVVDGNYNTYFDGVKNGYVILDLLEEKDIAGIAYAPRAGYVQRVNGAKIAGSKDGETWTDLYVIRKDGTAGQDTLVPADDFLTSDRSWRYIRYSTDDTLDCNLSELKIFEKESPATYNLQADFDMTLKDGKLADVSGKGHDAEITSLADDHFASYEGTSTLSFRQDGYVKLPAGMIEDGSNFTMQIVASAPKQSNHWLLTLGTKEGEWPNVDNYFFLTPNSDQGGYKGKLLAAISQGGETRMPASQQAVPAGYSEFTIVSSGNTLSVYVNGELVSNLEHSKDWTKILGSEDFIGYLGKSLYTPDPLFEGNIASVKVWNTALGEKELSQIAISDEEKLDAVKTDLVKAMLGSNRSVSQIDADLNLVSSIDGLSVEWIVDENIAIDASGKYTAPDQDVLFGVTARLGSGQTIDLQLTAPSENIPEILKEAADGLSIVHADDIRGNITLPETSGRASVSWSASPAGIIDTETKSAGDYGTIPAGVVTRPSEDTEVTLSAVITYKGESITKEIPVTVKAAPEKKEYTDYFFAYFTGEGKANGEQVYFSSSQDGLNWNDLNGGQPSLTSSLGEKGVRDPYLIRSAEGDRFFLIATDLKINGGNGWDAAQTAGSQSLLVWESDNLVDWSEPRLVPVSASIDAGCTWAPEAFYDDQTGEYVVFWASKVKEDNYAKQRVYFAKTRDFYSFTEAQVWIEKDQSSIDTTVIKDGDTYYRLTKNEGGSTNELGAKTKTLFLESSKSLLGDYTQIPSDSLNANQYVEGPAIFKLNADDSEQDSWILLADDFGGIGYYPLQTSSLASGEFEKLAAGTFKMPAGARHGTPIAITSDEYNAVMKAMGDPETVEASLIAGKELTLPETVHVGREEESVQWNTEAWQQPALPFETEQATGTTESGKIAKANVQLFPDELEYFVDCNNPNSATHAEAVELFDELLNKESADTAKTAQSSWGWVSSVGADGSGSDMCPFSQNSLNHPYAGGYWATSGKTMDYAFTLPAGDHTILVGNKGWWNMGRNMDVYAITSKGEMKLASCNAIRNANASASGTIHLDQEETITVSVRKTDNNDPILSWIAITGRETADKTALQAAIDAAMSLKAEDYAEASFAALETAIDAAKDVLANPDASPADIKKAAADLARANDALVHLYTIIFKDGETVLKTVRAEEGSDASALAPESMPEKEGFTFEGWSPALKTVEKDIDYTAVYEAIPAPADKSKLEALIETIESEQPKVEDYTEESWNAFDDALKNAREILESKTASQEEVDAVRAKLDSARKALAAKPSPEPEIDTTLLELVIGKAEKINLDLYQWKGQIALSMQLAAARNVLKDPASQQQVDEAAAKLNEKLLAIRMQPTKENLDQFVK